jgi:hypothetical protein
LTHAPSYKPIVNNTGLIPHPSKQRTSAQVEVAAAVADLLGEGEGAVKASATAKRLEMLIVWPSERSGPHYERQGFLPNTEMLECGVIGYQV